LRRRGGRVWLNALVLKTSIPQGIGGSNPSPSAIVSFIIKKGAVNEKLTKPIDGFNFFN
tara:strand:- start:475 stop:651 length:177 start_codon:yes stop_codon:yes gene_type:complete